MGKRKKLDLIEIILPLFLPIVFIIKMLYKVFLGWWLDPQSQRKENQRFLEDIEVSFGSLISEGRRIIEQDPPAILPFDGATVTILYKNIFFCFTRGRGDLTVLLAPHSNPEEKHELGLVVATLEGRHLMETDVVNSLPSAADMLMPRLKAINDAFSEESYSSIRGLL